MIRALADGLEWSYSRGAPTAQRLRFLLDLGYATGLRAGEFVGATLGDIRRDEHGDQRLHVIGKGENPARWRCLRWISLWFSVGCRSRRLAGTRPHRLVANLEEAGAGIESTRLWRVLRRFFLLVADAIQDKRPATAEKLRRASPHWIRHAHATHALARGAELIMVRDNRRHASISTMSAYLHSDEVRRTLQFDQAFEARKV
ncbi:tyrosine-type recombinase/integrase [Burkholderia pseudomallei]|uniref:tyrosine-type recombinase/integrase n=1 Tax=Burkholderia pseudomallei TaxID=28450 RepID=UPI000977178C|nr:tyrosine-type recombinase/integrase [Burkholderia pseudomallei]